MIGRVRKTLFWQISAAFLTVLLLLAFLEFIAFVYCWSSFSKETLQRTNWSVAEDMARHLAPALVPTARAVQIDILLQQLQMRHPDIDVYLIDNEGNIRASSFEFTELRRQQVDMEPVQLFLSGLPQAKLPLLGVDPRSGEGDRAFSAAPVRLGPVPGVVYAVFDGGSRDFVTRVIVSAYAARALLAATALVIGAAAVAGILLFRVLTSRFQRIKSAVDAIEGGDLGRRVEDRRDDDLGEMARSINRMADTILSLVEEQKRLDALRRQLVATISHDLRGPVAALNATSESIHAGAADWSRKMIREHTGLLLKSLGSLASLIENLFELSKLEARDRVPVPEPFSLRELAEYTLARVAPAVREKAIVCSVEAEPGLPPVHADAGMIERVFANLVENAVKYGTRGCRVAVTLRRVAGGVEVTIGDTGPGIPPEDLPHIFEEFFRGTERDAAKARGTGLGLAIVRRVLEAHGTTIRVRSSLGEGTAFSFSLPAAPEG